MLSGIMTKEVLNLDSIPYETDVSCERYGLQEALSEHTIMHPHTYTDFSNVFVSNGEGPAISSPTHSPCTILTLTSIPLSIRGSELALCKFLFSSTVVRYCCKVMYRSVIWCSCLFFMLLEGQLCINFVSLLS